jgi:very-short-patch-repair endonuclease
MSASKLEIEFVDLLKKTGLPRPDKEEFMFAKELGRKWRADFAYTENGMRLLVEIEGGEFINGRHNRNLRGDAEKYNNAVLLGYRVLRFTGSMLRSGEAMATMQRALL